MWAAMEMGFLFATACLSGGLFLLLAITYLAKLRRRNVRLQSSRSGR
jgi:hypothetical protein